MFLPCIEMKRFEESIFSCTWLLPTDGCNVMSRHNFLAQKLEAKIVSLVSAHCHAHRLASGCYYTAADLYSVVCETVKAL